MKTEKLQIILEEQKKITAEYEELIKNLSENDLLNENNQLKTELSETKEKLNEIDERYHSVLEHNLNLKIALKEQMFNEKNKIINNYKRKIELYFKDSVEKNENKLLNLEKKIKNKIKNIEKTISSEIEQEETEILNKLKNISIEVENTIEDSKQKIKNKKTDILEDLKSETEQMKKEKITDKTIEKKKKENNLEVKIGLNWVNKIGIFILLLGIATAMRYTYSTWFNDYMKGIFGFIIGISFLVAGEWFNNKSKDIFSLGLCGLGIATLYITTFASYFLLDITTVYVAILLSVLVTSVSFVLSQRYNSISITALSLIGGYLPFFSYAFMNELIGNQVYIAMGYLLILNLLILGVSFQKRWIKINYLSFLLNIPSMLYLVIISDNKNIALIYSLITLVMYLGITLIYPLLKKVKLKISDVILLSINTISNSLITYALFDYLGYDDFFGFLALGYSAIYLGLANIIKNNRNEEKKTVGLFYITSTTFAVLMIPFQFGIEWALFGWLVEALLLLSFGIFNKEKQFEIAGWFILILSTISFYIFGIEEFLRGPNQFKYLSLTVALVYTLGLYLIKGKHITALSNPKKFLFLKIYKYLVIVSTWVYFVESSNYLFNKFLDIKTVSYFFEILLVAVITLLFSYLISNIKLLQDKITKIINVILYIIGDIILLSLNFERLYLNENMSLKVFITVILIVFNILVFLNVKDLVLRLLKSRHLSIEFYPLTLAIYLLGVVSAFLINQFNFENINLIISILFIVFSFGYIFYGFKKNYVLLRRFGLGFSILSTAKLFLMDLTFLDSIGKIVAYISFGVVLIGISFMYQKLKNDIEVYEVDSND